MLGLRLGRERRGGGVPRGRRLGRAGLNVARGRRRERERGEFPSLIVLRGLLLLPLRLHDLSSHLSNLRGYQRLRDALPCRARDKPGIGCAAERVVNVRGEVDRQLESLDPLLRRGVGVQRGSGELDLQSNRITPGAAHGVELDGSSRTLLRDPLGGVDFRRGDLRLDPFAAGRVREPLADDLLPAARVRLEEVGEDLGAQRLLDLATCGDLACPERQREHADGEAAFAELERRSSCSSVAAPGQLIIEEDLHAADPVLADLAHEAVEVGGAERDRHRRHDRNPERGQRHRIGDALGHDDGIRRAEDRLVVQVRVRDLRRDPLPLVRVDRELVVLRRLSPIIESRRPGR